MGFTKRPQRALGLVFPVIAGITRGIGHEYH